MPSPTLSRRRAVPALLLSTAVLIAGAVVATRSPSTTGAPQQQVANQRAAVAAPLPVATVRTAAGGLAAWDRPLTVTVTEGTLVSVAATDPDGAPLPGALQPDGSWTSSRALIPLAAYRAQAQVRDSAGAVHRLGLSTRTSAPSGVLHAAVSPGDDAVVGVGQPVAVRLDRAVVDRTARLAVEQRLTVSATPTAVVGAWRWMSDKELHFRPAQFWTAGSKVHVSADLTRLSLPGGVWGSGVRTADFTIGRALVSTVDVAAHTMTVTRDGRVLRVLKASMGKPAFPTRGGTHLVLEKDATRIMNSDTVGLPGEYRTKVDWAVRLTYSGTFTHSAPWSVRDQGVRNVSHGCINLSPADAKWFFDQARRGDVVKVVNAAQGPKLTDPGAADWNVPFSQWPNA